MAFSKRVRIDERFIGQVGTEKQHGYLCVLASKAGYSALRYAISDATGVSVSKCARTYFTMKDASKAIEYLQAKIAKEEADAKERKEAAKGPTLFPMGENSAIEQGM